MKLTRIILLGVCVCFSSAAMAEIKVEERVLQKGLYSDKTCKATDKDEGYNPCLCDADIRYPEVTGLSDVKAQEAINHDFRMHAEQVKCSGDLLQNKSKESKADDQPKAPASSVYKYEVTFSSPKLLGLRFSSTRYTGGAHGDSTLEGVIVDLAKAQILPLEAILQSKDQPAVNKYIYETLSEQPEDEVFHDEIESRKDSFIHDNKCGGCTLTLMPDGIKVLFQTYEVASYAMGNIEIDIPENLVSYPAIKAMLAKHKTKASAEKN